jgi:hypothetical protein
MVVPSYTASDPDKLAATTAPAAVKEIATSPAMSAWSEGGPPAM